MIHRTVCFYLLVVLSVSKGDDWDEKMSALLKISNDYHSNQIKTHPESREGTIYYGIEFEGIPKPASVHRLRPGDISVIGALGDSITAANGAGADHLPGVINTYRGLSWSVGGDNTSETVMTLTNILRHFNPHIKGYSTGIGPMHRGFNVAVPGARAEDIPVQAEDLVTTMKNSSEIDYDNDWKIVSIFIGGNDLCDLEDEDGSSQPEQYIAKLQEGLDVLHRELPRTMVNVIEILDIYLLPQVAHGYGSTPQCRVAQQVECPYVGRADDAQLEHINEETKKYQQLTQELISSGRYDTRDDFTVVLQPFFRDTVLPYTEDGQVDATYFAPDCFHFSSKGHGMGAINLWNNMLEPVGKKSTTWAIKDLKVPTEEHPYIYTSKNSVIEEHDGGTNSEVCSSSIPEWLYAILALLAAGLLVESVALVMTLTKKKPKTEHRKQGKNNEAFERKENVYSTDL